MLTTSDHTPPQRYESEALTIRRIEAFEDPRVLIPFIAKEACTVSQAAKIAGKSAGTIRNWIERFHIGCRVGPSHFMVSKIALRLLLCREWPGLLDYLRGDRLGDRVLLHIIALEINPDAYGDN